MSLANALFTDSQSRVLRRLFGHAERSYHLSELRRLTGLGSASLQRELNRLADAGLVDSERLGNLRTFKANKNSPVFAELVSLTRKLLGLDDLLRDALQPLGESLKGAWIYGSVAKQNDTAQSDIDVMLVGDNLRLTNVLALLMPVEAQVDRKINPSCYSCAEFVRRLSEPDSFIRRVLDQPVIPLKGQLHELDRA